MLITTKRWAAASALPVLAALSLGACASTAESAESGGGVGLNATKEEYRAAFDGLEPITLRMQVDGPDGSLANAGRIAYAEAVEDWSDGKVTFDIGFSNSYVPAPNEWDNGLADGRLDVSFVIPSYEPDVYPLNNSLADASPLTPSTPSSTFVSSAWMSAVVMEDETYREELISEGVRPLIPAAPMASMTGLFCTTEKSTLDDFDGVMVAASGPGKTAQMQSLGLTAVSMPFTDQYEALERGVIDCAATSAGAVSIGGLLPLVPHMIVDERVAFSDSVLTFAVSEDRWEDLPLVARQLLFDRLDAYLTAEPLAQFERLAAVVEESATKHQGTVHGLADDALSEVHAANEALISAIDQADKYRDMQEKWEIRIDDGLSYGSDASTGDFLLDHGYRDFEIAAFVDTYMTEILAGHRPE